MALAVGCGNSEVALQSAQVGGSALIVLFSVKLSGDGLGRWILHLGGAAVGARAWQAGHSLSCVEWTRELGKWWL